MKILFTLLLSWFSAFCANIVSAQVVQQETGKGISIIPQPLSLKEHSGSFNLTSKSKIYIDPNDAELRLLAGMLADQLGSLAGYRIQVMEKASSPKRKNAIVLTKRQAADSLGKEGYSLSVRPENIIVRATHGHGIFYGLQTIYQLLPTNKNALATAAAVTIPALDVLDRPRYS